MVYDWFLLLWIFAKPFDDILALIQRAAVDKEAGDLSFSSDLNQSLLVFRAQVDVFQSLSAPGGSRGRWFPQKVRASSDFLLASAFLLPVRRAAVRRRTRHVSFFAYFFGRVFLTSSHCIADHRRMEDQMLLKLYKILQLN